MAQQVKLRRSSVAGNKPTTAQLELGELAINTNDGKLYFEKSSSLGESVQEIIVTDAWNTGSINVSGSVTVSGSINATSFIGSLFGTASYASNALSSSYALVSTSASYAATSTSASYASQATTASYANNATSASYANAATSASYALTASYAATASLAQNASDILVYVKNSSGAQINKGKVVRIIGAVGDNPLIATASYENDNNSANTLGITYQNIPNDDFGYVITEGTLIGINTNTFTAGQLIYLGATGSIIGTAPVAPLHAVRLGEVLRSQLNNGSIYIRVDNGYELGELHDVKDTSTTSSYGDLLVKSGSVWTNSNQLTGSYGLTGSLNATSFTGSLLGTASYATQALSSSYALNTTSASYALNATSAATASYANNFTVAGTLTAQTLVVQTITSSIIYSSGSNQFGDATNDTQLLIGTTKVTGSLEVTGSTTITGSLNVSSGITGSLLGTASYAVNALTASYYNGSVVSASYALTATSASYAQVAVSVSYFSGSISTAISASYAATASYAVLATTASYFSGSLSAPGSTTQILYNNGGTVAGDSGLVYSGSNVGIGTTSPGYKLEVNGTQRVVGNFYLYNTVTNVASNYSNQRGLGFDASTGATEIAASTVPLQLSRFSTTGDVLTIRHSGSYVSSLKTDGGAIFTGNVGIGTTSPLEILHLQSSQPVIQFTKTGILNWKIGNISGNNFTINTDAGGGDAFNILTNGNVGIGTTNPSARLSLGSSTNGERITWSDFSNVFSEYSSADLWLSANFYGNLGSSGYKTSFTAAYGAAGISVSSTGAGLDGVLRFFVNNAASKTAGDAFTPTERMRITGGGNVGIGTTSPTYNLHTYGTNPRNLIQDPSAGYPILQLNNASGNFYMSIDNSAGTGFGSAYGRYLYSDGAYPMMFVTNDVERMRITSGGNVGIGLTSPQKVLDVLSGANNFTTAGADNLSVGQWAGVHFGYRENNTDYRKSAIVFERTDLTSNNAQGKVHILNGPQAGAGSATLADAKLTINEAGQVGIGTTAPTLKLVVDGGSADFTPIWAKSSLLVSNKYYASIIAGYTLNTNQAAQFGYVYDTITPANSFAHITPYGSSEGSVFKINTTGAATFISSVTANSLIVSSSLIANQNTASLASGAQTISTNATSSYTAAFFNYTVASGSNARAGQVTAVWNGGSIQYTDVSTTDIGSTLGVAFTASLSGANVRLTTVLPTSGWTVKTLANLL